MNGTSVSLTVAAKIPAGSLPVTVRIRRPMNVRVLYMLPPVVSVPAVVSANKTVSPFGRQVQNGTSSDDTSSGVTTPDTTPDLNPPEQVLVGYAELDDEAMLLSNKPGASTSMTMSLHVRDAVAFGWMVDHLLMDTSAKAAANANVTNATNATNATAAFPWPTVIGGLDGRNYSVPVVLGIEVDIGAVDVMILNTSMLTIPNLSLKKTVLLKGESSDSGGGRCGRGRCRLINV